MDAAAALIREVSILILASLAVFLAVRVEGRERLILLPVALSTVAALAQ